MNKVKKGTVLFAVDNDEQLKEVLKITSTIFGGYTLTENKGGWKDEQTNKIIEETSYKLELITNQERAYFENLSQHICKIAKQKEVYYYIQDIQLNIIKNQ